MGTINTLQKEIAHGAVVVDPRIPVQYEAWNIPGSVNVPAAAVESKRLQIMKTVPRNARIIVWHPRSRGRDATTLATMLVRDGFSNVLISGLEWKKSYSEGE
jgi:rhodanese-related sulfurtransferase